MSKHILPELYLWYKITESIDWISFLNLVIFISVTNYPGGKKCDANTNCFLRRNVIYFIWNTWQRGGGWGHCWGWMAGLRGPEPPTAPPRRSTWSGWRHGRCNTVPTGTAMLNPVYEKNQWQNLLYKSRTIHCICNQFAIKWSGAVFCKSQTLRSHGGNLNEDLTRTSYTYCNWRN